MVIGNLTSLARVLFAVGSQAIALPPQQATNDRFANPAPVCVLLLMDVAQTAIEPFLVVHRMAGRMRCHHLQQDPYEGRVRERLLRTRTPRTHDPGRGQRYA